MKSNKLIAWIILASGILLFSISNAYAVDYPAKSKGADYFVDAANTISPEARGQINNIIGKLWRENHISIVVVTIPSLARVKATSMTVNDYAHSLYDFWGLTSDNNGILLLIDHDDKSAAIQLGQGWGNDYDATINQILQTKVIPNEKKGQYSNGIVAGLTSLDAMARGQYKVQAPPSKSVFGTLFGGLLILAILAAILSLFKPGRSGKIWVYIDKFTQIINNSGMGGGASGGSK
jgi:uncharacterized protein